MAIQADRLTIASALVLLAALFACPFAYAQVSGGGDKPGTSQCGCPSDGRDKPGANTGLGDATPKTTNLARDPEWRVYRFERDGIRYLQVNDVANRTRAAVGQIGATAWVLPIGRDADRVVVQEGATITINARVIYRDDSIELVYDRRSNQDRWIVRPVAGSR